MDKLRNTLRKTFVLMFISFVVGALVIVGIRFFNVKAEEAVHYHANFALYINGLRDEFKSPLYYEEVEKCDIHDKDDVHGRAHMHGMNNHVVHVHAHAVSWGAFFANLDYALSDQSVSTNKETFVDGQNGNKLTFILNGKEVDNIANKVIGNEDVLLVNYGNENQTDIMKRYKSIPHDAHQANISKDPGACGAAATIPFTTRLKEAMGFESNH
jgi:hypothetical protein